MRSTLAITAALAAAGLAACGGGGSSSPGPGPVALAGSCASLQSRISFANTTITSASEVAAGGLKVAGQDVPAHCLVEGSMFPRVSPVDGKAYAIGFEMRLPLQWNGRYFYQGNGGTDGDVTDAVGAVNGGGGLTNALHMGFAVISSDAGHTNPPGFAPPAWGVDPQARLDYGYQAAAKLTPMAKDVIRTAYGKGPDRSYFGGCSNGGRHTMVAATRLADQYDGYLVGAPGFRLPLAATANIAGAQKYATVATGPDLNTAFTAQERRTVADAVLAKCDALDGATDGMVQDIAACQTTFNLQTAVPTCTGARDGTCLTTAQKSVIAQLFAGATTSTGTRIYSSFPYDTGLATGGWAFWKFTVPLILDSGAVGLIFQVPPENPATFNGPAFALTGNVDTMLARVNATDATYTESAMSFMTPPKANDLSAMRSRGGKMLVYHGTSDPIFSSDDTAAWYRSLTGDASTAVDQFARYYPVPGMGHCSGGAATDQFDMLTPLVRWVEQGIAPASIVASARGAGNPAGANADLPAAWDANRTRPLCPYPKVARYVSGSIESAAGFSCM